jgi:hypothetical protein
MSVGVNFDFRETFPSGNSLRKLPDFNPLSKITVEGKLDCSPSFLIQ